MIVELYYFNMDSRPNDALVWKHVNDSWIPLYSATMGTKNIGMDTVAYFRMGIDDNGPLDANSLSGVIEDPL